MEDRDIRAEWRPRVASGGQSVARLFGRAFDLWGRDLSEARAEDVRAPGLKHVLRLIGPAGVALDPKQPSPQPTFVVR